MIFRKFSSRSKMFLWIIILSGLVMAAMASYALLKNEPALHQKDLKWVIPFVFTLFSVFMIGISVAVGILAELLIAALTGRSYERNKFTVAALVFHVILFIAVTKTVIGVLFFGAKF